jgi:hypothetical protein
VTVGYFYFFDEWAMDPKVQSLSFEMRWRHVMLLCLRNIGDTSKTPDNEVATFMGIGEEEARSTREVFRQKGFVDGDHWNVTNWEKRQSGQSESYERVKRYRERQRNVTCNVTVTPPVTLHETLPSNSPAPARAPVLTNLLTDEEKKNPRKRGEVFFDLPNRIPRSDWEDYETMRRSIRKPMTMRARELAVVKLDALMAQGYSPAAVLQQSTMNSWQGLFPLQADRNGKLPAAANLSTQTVYRTPEEIRKMQSDEKERVRLLEAELKIERERRERGEIS